MIIKSFKEFIKDYQEYYNAKDFIIKTESDFEDVIYELYDKEGFDIDYEHKIIEIF